jgi:hypothetical protein
MTSIRLDWWLLPLFLWATAALADEPPAVPGDEQWEWMTETFDGPDCGFIHHDNPAGEWNVTDGVLHLTDHGTAKGEMLFGVDAWEVDPGKGSILEARVKVVSCSGEAGVLLFVADGIHEGGITLYPDHLDAGFAQHPMDTTNDFHVYRVQFHGEDLRVFADGQLVIDGAGKFTRPAHQGRCLVMFGSVTSLDTGEAYWDWVRHTVRFVVSHESGVVGDGTTVPDYKPLPGVEHVPIYKREGVYACFPTVYKFVVSHESGVVGDGTTVPDYKQQLHVTVSTRVRASHIDPTGGSAALVSADGGRTWQLTDHPVGPGPWRVANGDLVRTACNWWVEHPESERAALEAKGYYVGTVREGVVAVCVGAYVQRSRDGGQTWERQEIDLPPMASVADFFGGRLQLRDGTLLHAVYGSEKVGDPSTSYVLRSPDGGVTWTRHVIAAPERPGENFDETSLLELEDGTILAAIRTGQGTDHLWVAWSSDGGVTWTKRDTGIVGHPATLLRLQDGRILMTYGYRHRPFGIRAVASPDGKTWDPESLWVLRDDGLNGDLGYPQTVQLADGTLVTVYYFVEKDGIHQAAGTRWTAPAALVAVADLLP